MQDLTGRVALITGAAGGLGAALARACARAGMKVALADLDQQRLDEARQALGTPAEESMSVLLDVSDFDAWQRAVADVEAALGPVALLVNNAGIGGGTALAQDDPERMRLIMAVNVFGTWYGCRTVLPTMLESGQPGHIVNVTSIAGMAYWGGNASYEGSKAAAIGITQSLRHELAGTNVGLTLVIPGMMRSRFVANTNAYLSGRARTEDADDRGFDEILKSGMDPDAVAAMILRAVVDGTYYVLPHPHWKPLIEATNAELTDAMNEPAEAGYTDHLPEMYLKAHREVAAGRAQSVG